MPSLAYDPADRVTMTTVTAIPVTERDAAYVGLDLQPIFHQLLKDLITNVRQMPSSRSALIHLLTPAVQLTGTAENYWLNSITKQMALDGGLLVILDHAQAIDLAEELDNARMTYECSKDGCTNYVTVAGDRCTGHQL